MRYKFYLFVITYFLIFSTIALCAQITIKQPEQLKQNTGQLKTGERNIRNQLLNLGATKFLKKLEEFNIIIYLENSPGPYTILAPTDQAFDNLMKQISMENNHHALRTTLESNIFYGERWLRDIDFADGKLLFSINGVLVPIAKYQDIPTINGARIIHGDVEAGKTIVIHLVDAIFLTHPITTTNFLTEFPSTKLFANIMEQFNLLNYIDQGPPFTVIVPTNQELKDVMVVTTHLNINNTINYLEDFLRRRVIAGFAFPVNFMHQTTIMSYDKSILNAMKTSEKEFTIGGNKMLLDSLVRTRNGLLYFSSNDQENPKETDTEFTEFGRSYASRNRNQIPLPYSHYFAPYNYRIFKPMLLKYHKKPRPWKQQISHNHHGGYYTKYYGNKKFGETFLSPDGKGYFTVVDCRKDSRFQPETTNHDDLHGEKLTGSNDDHQYVNHPYGMDYLKYPSYGNVGGGVMQFYDHM